MAGYRTFNDTNKSLWVTIYNMPGEFQVDWGEVGPRSWRPWESGPYARLSYYKVRGEWPMTGPTCDEAITNRLDGSFVLKPYTFVEWQGKCWWTRPAWRTINTLDRPIWVTIYNYPGDQKCDWGEVGAHAHRDWFSGEYGPDTHYRIRAESIPNGTDFDVETTSTFQGGWGQATFVKEPDGTYAWRVNGNPSAADSASVEPPRELEAGDAVSPPVAQ